MRAIDSPDMRVMLQPARAYREFGIRTTALRGWRAAQRPAFLVFLLGCLVSVVTGDGLNLRLFAAGVLNGVFVPVLEIAVLAALWRGARKVPFGRMVDLFFMGHGPWVFWMLVMCAIWVFAEPPLAFRLTGQGMWFLFAVAFVWSGYIDFCFFREVLGENGARAWTKVIVLRAVTWIVGLAYFGGGSLLPEAMRLVKP